MDLREAGEAMNETISQNRPRNSGLKPVLEMSIYVLRCSVSRFSFECVLHLNYTWNGNQAFQWSHSDSGRRRVIADCKRIQKCGLLPRTRLRQYNTCLKRQYPRAHRIMRHLRIREVAAEAPMADSQPCTRNRLFSYQSLRCGLCLRSCREAIFLSESEYKPYVHSNKINLQ